MGLSAAIHHQRPQPAALDAQRRQQCARWGPWAEHLREFGLLRGTSSANACSVSGPTISMARGQVGPPGRRLAGASRCAIATRADRTQHQRLLGWIAQEQHGAAGPIEQRDRLLHHKLHHRIAIVRHEQRCAHRQQCVELLA
ncbi:MAG: hypothetical protein U0Z44_20245 [Kouleothrix sp.]